MKITTFLITVLYLAIFSSVLYGHKQAAKGLEKTALEKSPKQIRVDQKQAGLTKYTNLGRL